MRETIPLAAFYLLYRIDFEMKIRLNSYYRHNVCLFDITNIFLAFFLVFKHLFFCHLCLKFQITKNY